jgi:hypothetical protein
MITVSIKFFGGAIGSEPRRRALEDRGALAAIALTGLKTRHYNLSEGLRKTPAKPSYPCTPVLLTFY